jgi:hypothetical protein
MLRYMIHLELIPHMVRDKELTSFFCMEHPVIPVSSAKRLCALCIVLAFAMVWMFVSLQIVQKYVVVVFTHVHIIYFYQIHLLILLS